MIFVYCKLVWDQPSCMFLYLCSKLSEILLINPHTLSSETATILYLNCLGSRLLTYRWFLFNFHSIYCDMMSCHVMSCHVMWYDMDDVRLCHVMWCDVMWCDVMWCDVMWCDVMRCDVMWCDVIWYDMIWMMWDYVMSCHVTSYDVM